MTEGAEIFQKVRNSQCIATNICDVYIFGKSVGCAKNGNKKMLGGDIRYILNKGCF